MVVASAFAAAPCDYGGADQIATEQAERLRSPKSLFRNSTLPHDGVA
jgi:hypothetical protein